MLIKKGSRGPEVKKVQEFLGLTADGVFGSGTEAAVKKWQGENNLVAEGIVAALETMTMDVPLVIRLQGTNAEEGAKVLEESGLEFTVARGLQEAAEGVVKAVKGAA